MFATWALVELIEAAVAQRAAPSALPTRLERLSAATRASGTDWALGIEARSRALLSEGDGAERLYREAIERLGRTRIARRARPRPSRSTANGCAASAGAWTPASSCAPPTRCSRRWASRRSPSAPRASCWPPARPPASAPSRPATELTAQEAQIARLARDGLSNPEIGARLFISPRTVEYHLHKVFAKLDITSRTQLHIALPRHQGAA